MQALDHIADRSSTENVVDVLAGASMEVLPKTAAKISRFRDLLPQYTRIYIAHIDGTPIEDMLATAGRIRAEGFSVMPHIPARSIPNRATLREWIVRYADVGVDEFLLLAGGRARPVGGYDNSMELLESGEFAKARRIHFAGHPEGNRDIDPDGNWRRQDEALQWKQAYADRSEAEFAIVTQFLFDSAALFNWINRIRSQGITMPVHAGVSGPTKLQSLIRYAITCGLGPSISVLKKRALNLSALLVPFAPNDFVRELGVWRRNNPEAGLNQLHIYPLGGIAPTVEWLKSRLPATTAYERKGEP